MAEVPRVSMLMLNGVEIAAVDAEAAEALIAMARSGVGRMMRPMTVTMPKIDSHDFRSLAGGALMMRTHAATRAVSLELEFTEVSESIGRTTIV